MERGERSCVVGQNVVDYVQIDHRGGGEGVLVLFMALKSRIDVGEGLALYFCGVPMMRPLNSLFHPRLETRRRTFGRIFQNFLRRAPPFPSIILIPSDQRLRHSNHGPLTSWENSPCRPTTRPVSRGKTASGTRPSERSRDHQRPARPK